MLAPKDSKVHPALTTPIDNASLISNINKSIVVPVPLYELLRRADRLWSKVRILTFISPPPHTEIRRDQHGNLPELRV
jgi:hypothetical protein